MTERINARLDDELARKLRYLRELTGATTTEVLCASLEAYYEQITSRHEPGRLLGDFIGCAEGPSDLSTAYKQALTSSLTAKARGQ